MKTFVGVDLGSTITKAIVLDENGHVIGRGVTDTRSNYAAAARSAQEAARNDARFTLLGRALGGPSGLNGRSEGFLRALERAFRLELFLDHLEAIEESCRKQAKGERFAGVEDALREGLFEIFARLRRQAPALYVPHAKPAADSIVELVRSCYLRHAEDVANDVKLPCDLLLNVYDRSIAAVENRPPDNAEGRRFRRSLARLVTADPSLTIIVNELQTTIDRVLGVELEETFLVGTGYGRVTLPFSREHIRSEILCHGLGAHMMFPNTRTVLDIGGQDTKGIRIDRGGIVENFQMNDRCAAGCGRYLGYIANEMNIGLHELGPLALRSQSPAPINSTCTVFAGAELRDRLSLGEKREDILAGLHRAIVLRALSIIARLGGVIDEFTFTGGVAKNGAAVRALRNLVTENYGEATINISPESIYAGALGAAEFARRADQSGVRAGATA